MLQIPNYPYQFLLAGGSGSGKRNTLLNLINHHNDIDKIYLFAKDPYDTKDQFLIFKDQSVGSKHCNDPKSFYECSNNMDDIYENIGEYSPNKNFKILIVFDFIIVGILNSKKLDPIVRELFIRGRRINSSLVFIIQTLD